MNTTTAVPSVRPRSYWAIAVLALIWNLIGAAMLYLQVNMPTKALAQMTEPQRQVYEATPQWLNIAFAVAVLGGVLGAIGLLMKKRWAATLFLLSLIGLLVQLIGAYVVTPAWAAYGVAGLVMPAVLLAIAVFLLWYANRAQDRGWLA
ncbi:hypothetical protein [Pseudoxanthomonas putridarboris]|uniref:Sugar transporter n=1 Tax=Pseudoxanthomonas putridarboris TaxID=752605 RepID=A0ABU9J3F5_9GAMM